MATSSSSPGGASALTPRPPCPRSRKPTAAAQRAARSPGAGEGRRGRRDAGVLELAKLPRGSCSPGLQPRSSHRSEVSPAHGPPLGTMCHDYARWHSHPFRGVIVVTPESRAPPGWRPRWQQPEQSAWCPLRVNRRLGGRQQVSSAGTRSPEAGAGIGPSGPPLASATSLCAGPPVPPLGGPLQTRADVRPAGAGPRPRPHLAQPTPSPRHQATHPKERGC